MRPLLVSVVLGVLAAPMIAGAVNGPTIQQAQGPSERLVELCRAGRLDSTFEALCFELQRERAETESLGDPFWDWLDAEPKLRRCSLAAAARCGPRVFTNLAILRKAAAAETERFPELAAAFAAAWTRGDGPDPARFWVDGWLKEGRAIPGFVESFTDFARRAKVLRFPVGKAPWQVLAHLADSIVPMEERAWAFSEYDTRKTEGLRNLFGAVPYTLDPKRKGGPFTLQSFLECGGPCTHNVQFAGGVFDAFGIPSGWAGGPGHTYPYWFEQDGKALRIFRTNEIGNRSGKIRDPLSSGHIWEDRLRLMVASLNRGQDDHDRAALAAWAFSRVPEKDRAQAASILVAALDASPLSYPALLAAAEATKARQLSAPAAAPIWRRAAVEMSESHPEELADLLDIAFPAIGDGPATFDGDVATLARFEKRHGARIAPWRFGLWRARALAARGKLPGSRRALQEAALELASLDPASFGRLIEDLLRITEPGKPRIKALRTVFEDLEAPEGPDNTKTLRSRLLAAAALQSAYGEDSRSRTGHRIWVDELVAQAAQRGGSSAGPVGGGGGAAFEQRVAGAELMGIRVTTTVFNGRTVVGSIQGLFRSAAAGPIVHEAAGGVRSEAADLLVPEGWTLWAIVAAGSDRVDGIQIIATPAAVWRGEADVSPWIGSGRERARLLGGAAGGIEALTGRAGADLDAVGVRLGEPR